jgi:hypothetical protein
MGFTIREGGVTTTQPWSSSPYVERSQPACRFRFILSIAAEKKARDPFSQSYA